jgi:hypothetical protein
MEQAQRHEREEILPLGHKTRPAREKRTAKGVGGGCDAAPLRAHKERGGVGEERRSKYSTEDDLAPRFEILQGRARLGVKYAETLGYRFVALEGMALDPLGWRLPFMPDGAPIHRSAWKGCSRN